MLNADVAIAMHGVLVLLIVGAYGFGWKEFRSIRSELSQQRSRLDWLRGRLGYNGDPEEGE